MEKQTRMVGQTVLACVLIMCGPISCATVNKAERARVAKLESRLRRANIRIETLREMNAVLKNRIKIAKDNSAQNGDDPQLAAEHLAAFKPGVQLDVPVKLIAPTAPKRQDVSLVPRSLPPKRALRKPAAAEPSEPVNSERADRVLARTVTDLLKSGDAAEAERTAALLEKSYPESELIAETRFQQGLFHFRLGNLQPADRFFQATLKAPKTHVRAKAGAVLMRGIIARRLADEGTTAGRSQSVVQTNRDLSRKSFEYVREAFPGSPEAKRAGRELARMK